MRATRTLIAVSLMAAVLAACGPTDDGNSSSSRTTDNNATSSRSATPKATDIPAPEIPKGKIIAKGDLCRLIPVDKAAEVLGQPSLETEPWKTTEIDPSVIDACNLMRFDDKGTEDPSDDENFGMNIFVRNDGARIMRAARNLLTINGDEVTDYGITGYDDAFYARREGNILKGDILYTANGSVGKQDGDRTMKFLTMLANSFS